MRFCNISPSNQPALSSLPRRTPRIGAKHILLIIAFILMEPVIIVSQRAFGNPRMCVTTIRKIMQLTWTWQRKIALCVSVCRKSEQSKGGGRGSKTDSATSLLERSEAFWQGLQNLTPPQRRQKSRHEGAKQE